MRGGLMLGAVAAVLAVTGASGPALAYCTPGDATCARLEALGKDDGRPRRSAVLPAAPDRKQQRYDRAVEEFGREKAGARSEAEQEAWEAGRRRAAEGAAASGLTAILPEEREAAAAGEAAAKKEDGKEGASAIKAPAVAGGPAKPRRDGPPIFVNGRKAN